MRNFSELKLHMSFMQYELDRHAKIEKLNKRLKAKRAKERAAKLAVRLAKQENIKEV